MNPESAIPALRAHTPLPGRRIGGLAAWHGDELRRDGGWIYELSARDLREIEAAVGRAVKKGVRPDSLRREDFPLPALSGRLAKISRALEFGRGIALMRGFPLTQYGDDELRLAFTGLGVHFGVPRFQNAYGERLREIRDEGADRGERYGTVKSKAGDFLSSRARVASTGELRFHTDRADLVALLCRRPPKSGGLTRISSSVAVHNAMLAQRPDLLECLYRPYPRSRFGEEAKTNNRFYLLPVMGLRDGYFTSHYSRTYIEAAQLIEDAPRLSDMQWEAIDMLAKLAAELCLTMRFESGDVQILNSHVTYHSRTAYEDHADPARKRVLYRLWLCPPNNRPLPEDHAVLWGDTGARTLRGGIGQAVEAPL